MFTLKDENPHWREVLLIIEIRLFAPVSNASLESLFSRIRACYEYIKSDFRNHLSNKAPNTVLRMKTLGITIDDFHKDHVQMC